MLLGIAVTRAASIDPTWTTVHLIAAALARGHAVRVVEPWDYEVDGRGHLVARVHAFDPPDPGVDALVAALRGRTAERRYIRLDHLDVLLVRAAPFDATILAFAAMVEERGVPVVNRPEGMLKVSHKAWLAGLQDVPRPPTLVTQSLGTARLFVERQRGPVIVKPARGSGGREVSFVRRRREADLEDAFRRARVVGGHVVVQRYLEEAADGEKRVVWMDGEVLGAYLRTRAEGEFRHNLKRGGTAVSTVLTPADHRALDAVGPHLLDAGIRLAGIDLIGGQVIEVNALNPGGAYHADRLHGTDVRGAIVDRLEAGALDLEADHPTEEPWVRPAR